MNTRILLAAAAALAFCATGCDTPDFPIPQDSSAAGEGAQTFPSGLILTEITPGTGESPGPTDVVEVHYHGTFPDGKVFDSSVERGTPARFPLNGVIPCWTEGVQKLKVGGKSQLICPPAIAYGAAGAPPRIPANATLHFDVELISIQR